MTAGWTASLQTRPTTTASGDRTAGRLVNVRGSLAIHPLASLELAPPMG